MGDAPKIQPLKASAEFQALMEMVMVGVMSASVSNKIAVGHAADAEAMGNRMHPEMEMLAALGANGRYPNKIWQELAEKLDLDGCTLPGPLLWPLPVLDHSESPPKVVWEEWPFFLLQDLLHSLYHKHPGEFRSRFLGAPGELERFWAGTKPDDPRLAHHPLQFQDDWRSTAIPGRLHADGVPYGKAKKASAAVHNLSSMLAEGETLDILNLWWWLPKHIACNMSQHGEDTEKHAWKIAVWDLLCCLRGEFLPFDWDGKEIKYGHPRHGKQGRIMGRYCFPVIQVTADTEHHANVWRLRHWGAHLPCDWCPASAAPGCPVGLMFSNFAGLNEWMSQLVTLEQWEENPTPHPLWLAHTLHGITIFSICFDILHILDLGVLLYFLASVIWTLVHDSDLSGNFKDRAEHVWGLLQLEYRSLGTQTRERLDRSEFMSAFGGQTGPTPSSFPELSGCKAAKVRHAVPALFQVTEKVQADQGLTKEEHILRLEALRMLVEFYSILDANGHHVCDRDAERIVSVVDAFLQKQNELAMIYWERVIKLYNITFKSHLFWHMARQCKFFNPRRGWAYRDESFVGTVAKTIHSIMPGNPQIKMGKPMASKWRQLMWFRLRRREGAVFGADCGAVRQ